MIKHFGAGFHICRARANNNFSTCNSVLPEQEASTQPKCTCRSSMIGCARGKNKHRSGSKPLYGNERRQSVWRKSNGAFLINKITSTRNKHSKPPLRGARRRRRRGEEKCDTSRKLQSTTFHNEKIKNANNGG